MTAPVDNRHRFLALGLTVIVLILGFEVFDRVWIGKHNYYQEHLADLQDRLQRLNGLLSTQDDLEQMLERIRQDSSADAYYLPEESPTLAATSLQQRVRQAVESNGGNLVSTQILPVVAEDGFSRVAIRVQMTGDIDAVQKMLYALESARPLSFIDALQIRAQPVRRRRTAGGDTDAQEMQLITQFELAGYMPEVADASQG